jgi:CRISPR-associated protein Csy2
VIKIVSGDVISFNENRIRTFGIKEDRDFKNLLRYLMPGFCLVSRQDLMQKEMQKGKDAIDAILEYPPRFFNKRRWLSILSKRISF